MKDPSPRFYCILAGFNYHQCVISLKKLEDIAYLAFQNALRLHSDAIALFGDKRYPSAFLLSILCQEEIGKMHIANDFVFHNNRPEDRDEKLEEEWLGLLYRHPHKQHSFLRNSPLGNIGSAKSRALMQDVFDGALEVKKQTSTYVGLTRKGRKIDLKGKIKHPFQISKKAAQEQITNVNDYLLFIGLGARTGGWTQDIEDIERQIKSKQFIFSISKGWKHKSPATIKLISNWKKRLGKRVIPI